eukprot:gene13629-16045_t
MVSSGQLEFVGGGWAQNDEALTHYQAVINQMTLGHQFLLSTFGVRPVAGWQIDPFGPSTVTATLFKLMGIKYHVIDRLDQRVKYVQSGYPRIPGSGAMVTNRSFEFTWYPSPDNYGPEFSIFTHVLDNHYNSPKVCFPIPMDKNKTECVGFDFEKNPLHNPPITKVNVVERAESLVSIIKERAALYRHHNVLIPFGDDFRYQDAALEFDNMDILVAHINANKTFGVNIKYATLVEYFDQVMNVTKTDDFPTLVGEDYFTYTQCMEVDYTGYGTCAKYWSGYFSSYPLLKQTVRQSDSILRTAETLYSIATATNRQNGFSINTDQAFSTLAFHRNVSGILTHHDAVTGTAKEYVRDNYFDMLYQAQNQTLDMLPGLVGYVLANETIEMEYGFTDILLAGMTPGQVVVASFTNSLAWNRVEFVRLPIGEQNYAVYDGSNTRVVSQMTQRMDRHAEWNLYFEVSVPALGVASYFIECLGDELPANAHAQPIHIDPKANDVSIGFGEFSLIFEPNAANQNILEIVGYSIGSTTMPFSQTLMQYGSLSDDCYTFRPSGPATPLAATSANFYINNGPIVQIVTVAYNNNVTQLFSVFNQTSSASGSGAQSTQFFEIESTVSANNNQEIIMRFNTPINNSKTFYTSNGIEMMERVWQEKFEDQYEWSLIAGNYYPVINTAKIEDSELELAVLLPQSIGASSLANGQLEFLMIRRSNHTQTSIHEELDDTSVTSIRSRVLFGGSATVEAIRTPHSLVHENPMIPMFAPVKGDDIALYISQHNTVFSPLNGQQLPQNLHLLSLTRQWSDRSQDAILRLMNVYEQNQASEFSKPSTVSFSNLFSAFNITDVSCTTMTGNNVLNATISLPFVITLNPVEIQTYTMGFNSIGDSSTGSTSNHNDDSIIAINIV